jgi:threonine aldolase
MAEMFDLRSDTVTLPTAAMRKAMADAPLGDDVFREDPTVKALEERTAELIGKEAALFVPSGTMANQIALLCHTRPGDEVICGQGSHCVAYESGAAAAWSGVQMREVGRGGLFGAADVQAAIQPDAYHLPRTRLVIVENTHNRSGGRIFPQSDVEAIAAIARERGLSLHLDGARIWNAAVAIGQPPNELCAPFDTVSVCFSKGLGAPVGSAICGARVRIDDALRFRKMLGGGMRQAGMIAAGALHALDHHRARLADDHQAAAQLAAALGQLEGVEVARVDTNIVNVEVPIDAATVVKRALEHDVLFFAVGPSTVRLVTHLGVSGRGFDACLAALVTSFRSALGRA